MSQRIVAALLVSGFVLAGCSGSSSDGIGPTDPTSGNGNPGTSSGVGVFHANFVPLSGPRVEGVVKSLKPYAFDRVHGAFNDRTIWQDGKGVVERSAARYLEIIRGDGSYELR